MFWWVSWLIELNNFKFQVIVDCIWVLLGNCYILKISMLKPILSFELTLALLLHVSSLTFHFFFLVNEGARQGRSLFNNSWVPRFERTRVLLVQTRLLGNGRRQLVIGLFKWASLLYRIRNSDHHFGVLAWIGWSSQLWLLILEL